MGNCSAACLHQKQSINEIDPRVGKGSKSRLTNESLTSARVELKRSRRNKSASAAISKVWRRGKKTRVSPCDDGMNTSQGGSNHSSHAKQPSDSSGFSESTLKTLSSSSIFLNGSFPEDQKSRTPSPFIQPGITQGRLIIVQPCRSMSSTSYVDTSSTECGPCGSAPKMPINEETETVEPVDICTSTSSLGTWTDDPIDIELDALSEEESCQVYPYDGI